MLSFVETRLFTRLVQQYLSEEEYLALQEFLAEDPEAGDVIPGSGGVRKMRWGGKGRGKRGGYRIIYFVRLAHGQIWLLTIYPKSTTESIPAYRLRQIRKEIEDA